jgi:pimeloyl-ACP methyl ester carboxylesterase
MSTFTSIPDIGAELFPWLPVRLLARIKYETHQKLPRIRVPVLIMHSRSDRLVSFRHSEENFAAANEPKLSWELRGGHNEVLSDREQFIAGIEKFLRMVEKTRGVAGACPSSGTASEEYQQG